MVLGLPRFDDWGGGACVDAQYGIGYLLALLREPAWDDHLPEDARRRFAEAWRTAVDATLDPEVLTCREVGPLLSRPREAPEGFLPGRRLSQSEPCVGGPGMLLQLLRHALVTELPEPDGRLGRRLRFLAGAPAAWRAPGLVAEGLPTRAGPVSLRWGPEGFEVHAPGAEGLEEIQCTP